jgi:hypothetical protein
MAEERGAAVVLPRDLRAHQGNEEITTWCPKCEERVVPLSSGACGWCDTDLSAEAPAEPEASLELASPEPVAVAAWRDEEVVEWLRGDGPAVPVEIRERFGIPKGSIGGLLQRLRTRGLIERTGVTRCMPGRAGRPGPEFRAVEPGDDSGFTNHESSFTKHELTPPPTPDALLGAAGDVVDRDGAGRTIAETIADRRDSGVTIDPTPFGDRPGASERTRRISEEVRVELEGRYQPDEIEPAAPMTVHEQLVVRYLGALIGRVERAGMGGISEPPEHIYERVERILQIEGGAA